MIAIIDYDAGNLKSVEKAFEYIGEKTLITRSRDEILRADKVILPGVGAFEDAMINLKKYNLDKIIYEVVENRVPFLGICLGLQLLFEGSDESPGVEGLGILKGRIVKIPKQNDLKIPHIGWNSLKLRNNGRLFRGINENEHVYFVHSFYLQSEDKNIVKATTTYGVDIDASVEADNVFACQFHPEKSSSAGLQILTNFANI